MNRLCIFLLLSGGLAFGADIIDSSRRTTWQGYVGKVGGIPPQTQTIHANISSGASAATVQAAMDSCPAGQVVKLAAGSYSFSNTDINWAGNSGVILRGAGPSSTTITVANGQFLISPGASEAALSQEANLSVDAVKGEFTVTLASVPSWVTAGELIGIDQLNESEFVADAGTEGGQSYRDIMGNGDRGMVQLNKVVSKTATTITLESPLLYGWKTAQTAQIFQPFYDPSANQSLKGCAIEDLKIVSTGTSSANHLVKMEMCDGAWFSNVEFENIAGGAHIYAVASYRCEVRNSYFHDSHLQDSGNGYGVALYHFSCGWLIEDNIFEDLHNAQTLNYGSSGNVYAYNFEANGTSDSGQNPGMNTHGVHPTFNLFEGNVCEDKVLADWTHGSSSHNTVFRNRVTGENGTGDSRTVISVEYYNRYWNIVGNILGTPSLQNKLYRHSGSTAAGSTGDIFRLGGEVNINGDFTPADAFAYDSGMFILVHANYDTINSSVTYNAPSGQAIAETTLADSYYTTRPSVWPSMWPWPRIIPGTTSASVAQATVETLVPAAWRYYNPGEEYPDLGFGGGTVGSITATGITAAGVRFQ